MKSVDYSRDTQAGAGGRIETTSIELPGGWRGRVTVACDDASLKGHLPDASAWRRALQSFIADPRSMTDATTLKYVPGAEVVRATIAHGGDNLTLIAKHHSAESVGARLSALVGGSRARRNFDRAVALARSGIHTALPLAMIERARPVRESWLFTAYVPDLIDLDRLVLAVLPRVRAKDLPRIKRRVGQAVVTLLQRLAQSGWHHRDLKASNILIRQYENNEEPAQAWIVDLDGLSPATGPGAKRERQRLVRLAASLKGYAVVTRADTARFLRTYFEGESETRDWHGEFRPLSRDAQRYADQSRRRKGHKFDGHAGD